MHPSGDYAAERQSTLFLILYALAVAGGAIAYVPFLTILLPAHVTGFAGEGSLSVLAHIAFAGAVSASIANILFGWLSDMAGTRRPWIIGGLILASAMLLTVRHITDPALLITAIILWQFALNMMLAPLAAWAGDTVPDAQKGLLGGLLAFAPAMGALAGYIVTAAPLLTPDYRLPAVAALTILCVSPVLLLGIPRAIAPASTLSGPRHPLSSLKNMASRMWLARFLVQIAEASLFAFLLVWFRKLDPAFPDERVAAIFSAVLASAVLLALWLGHWSDRHRKPIQPLALCAGMSALGLGIMASASDIALAIVGYVIFGLGGSIFLALHSSQTLRVLLDPTRRGRDLGIFNLTNTVPSLVMPWLTLALVPVYGFGVLFLLLALLALAAAILLAIEIG